jgi:gliding motility-associated-like protein
VKIKLFIFLLIVSQSIIAQHEADNWFFGAFAGLEFSTGTPLSVSGGRLDTFEGCSTISDRYGNLLFYTDGIKVYNRNHDVMQNGTGLLGNPSSTQSAVVIPKPAVPGVYYIFTVAAYAEDPGLNYSTVDMALDGGLGGVIPSQKNIQLVANTHEKITAVEHADGNSLWVITYKPNSFYAYKVSASGVDPAAIVSSTGIYSTTTQYPYHGYLKASPDGSLLACAHQSDQKMLLYDFDATTGQVSNMRDLALDTNYGPYGIEFSKSGERLYVSVTENSDSQAENYISRLYQFDITAASISASRQLISTDPVYRGALQLASDGKIYRAISKNYNDRTYHTLGVINNPDILGTACFYQNATVNLVGGISKQGLPPFITSFFNAAIRFENICVGDDTHFWINTIETIDSITWDFGDGSTSTAIEPLHAYAVGGTYTVTADVVVAGQHHIYTKEVFISAIPIATQPNDLDACGNGDGTANFDLIQQDAIILNGQPDLVVYYYESLVDANNNEHALESPYLGVEGQTIYAGLTNEYGCSDITNFQLHIKPTPDRNQPSDIASLAVDGNHSTFDFNISTTPEVINGQTDISVSYFENYTDAFDNNNALIMPYNNLTNPQTIYVRSENILTGCFIIMDFQVILKSIFPPFFTPNGDNYNDTWHAIASLLPQGTNIYIYDRFGKLIHTMTEQDIGWNGKYGLVDMPATDYWFKAVLADGLTVRGHFSLIR